MPKFSDRLGITKPPTEIQVDSINTELRNSLWNLFTTFIYSGYWCSLLKQFYVDYFKLIIEDVPAATDKCRDWFRKRFSECEWFEVYNLIQHMLQDESLHKYFDKKSGNFEERLNLVLERELSGYRAIKGEIVPITDLHEVETIHQAADTTSSLSLSGVTQHINAALHLLGRKPEPDYRNSIKESISAVESLCKLLTGKSGELKGPLNELASKIDLHPALKGGFLNLYGYTSDEDGIRHAILESKDIGFAEAKFMLVTCSAFVNFLIDKARQSGLL